MAKIETYILATQPLSFSDMLIGTEVGGPIPNATKNFSLAELYNLFASLPAVGNLQQTLNAGNTATQNIFLTGNITSTNIKPTYIIDGLNTTGAVGEVLIRSFSGISWGPSVPATIQQVLNAGNTATQNIILTGNITSTQVIPGNIKDGLGNLGTIGQILSKTSTGIQWINNVAGVQDLQSVLNIGNTATANIILTGNITSTNLSGTNTGDQTTITGNAGTATVLQTARIIGTLTGDASSAGSSFNGAADNTNALTLATVNTNVGSFTNSTITVNAKGLVTAASSGASAVTTVTATTPLSSSGGSTPNLTIQQSSGSQNGYLSGTDWTTFNNKQPAGNYITSLTGEATGTGPGATSVILSNAAVIGKLLTGLSITGSTISSSDNILTAFGKVQNQINGLIGGVQFQGVWNAATNTPALVSSVGTQGYYYIVDVAGNTNLNGISDWQVGDWAIFNGSTWNKVDNTDLVTSVNGQTGAVSLTTDNIPEGATNLYYLDSRARAALSFAAGSGAYNGTTGVITIPTDNSQILNGAGYITLVSLSATSPLSYNNLTGAFSIQVANTTQDGYLSSTDWNTFNGKQNYLNGTGLVKSVAGVISYITDNSANWNTAYNDSIVSAAVTGTATKTLTLNQQDGGTITASWSDIDTGLTSVGVSMPSAFSVANSPLITNGTIAITGAGVASQYIRGDGTLANFPTSGGGGASVSYYLNGSVSQGTIGGVAYKEINGVPVIGTGTDFTINADGYIAQFITDVGDPNKLLIPAGNWNFETYFSASSGGGSPRFYIELYKYNGATFTLIATNSATPENITGGTSIDLYFTALAVPSTSLLITDRLAVRFYVIHSGRTITMHTEDSHLSQIITTFSSGLTALNGLTSQVQYLAVGTTGTDFGISSATDTHTFNLPTASASNRGALSSADWTTFNSKEPAITAGTTLQYYRGDKTFQTLNTTVVPEGTNLYYLDSRARTAISLTTTGSSGASTYNNTTGVFNIPNYGSALSGYVPTSRQLTINGTAYDLSADRSWSVGTVTSVAALTLGTTGTDLSSSVATGTTTPVITLNVPTASAANRGALSSADWSTFNTKVGGVTATTPLSSTGGSTPNITIQQASGSQAGYLSSTDWTTFNNKQVAGNYITSLTGEATATGPGAAAVTLDNASVTAKILTGVNITGGTVLATDTMLTAFGKLQNQVNGLIGGSIYQGTWNASTNTPTLTSSVGTAGYYYIVSVAGTTNLNGITDWQVGDWAIFNGGVWQKVDNTDAVVSVNGQTGAVSLTTDNISEGVTNLYFTNTRARAALSFVAGSGAYNSSTGAITIPTNTSQLTNGANFITLASLSGTAPISYNSGTGAISITQSGTASNGYLSSTDWNTFNNKQGTISLTTTGTSGAATFSANTLNIPQYQGVLTNPVTGTGTTNYLPKFTGTSTIGNSAFYDGGGFGGFNSVGLGSRTFVIQAATSRPLAIELIENANVHAVYVRPNNSGYNLISSNYISGGVYIPLALSGRESISDLVLWTNGNTSIGQSTDAGYKLDVNGTGRFSGALTGTSATFSGIITANSAASAANGSINIENTDPTVRFRVTGGTANKRIYEWRAVAVGGVYDIMQLRLWNDAQSSATQLLQIASTGAATFSSSVTATSFIKSGGTSSQFLMADGSVNTSILPSGAYLPLTGGTLTGALNGTSATFSSDITASGTGNIVIKAASSNNFPLFQLQDSRVGGTTWNIEGGRTLGNLQIRSNIAGGTVLEIASTGAATFSSNVTATSFIPSGATVPPNGMYLSAANTLNFATNTTNRLTINSSGNLGLGVTPSAWGTGYSSLQVSNTSLFGSSSLDLNLASNMYLDNVGYKYISSGYATLYNQYQGKHFWSTAPSGTAGNAITFTQAMTLTAAGRLLLGTTTESTYLLDVNGTGRFSGALSGTSASFSSTATATAFIPSGATVPTNGMYLSAANTLNFATNTTNRLTIASTGAATFSSALNIGGNQTFTGVAGTTRYIVTDESSTGTGRLVIQAGAGSASFGGAINLYAASHPTYTGDVAIGLSATTGAKFRVNTSGLDGGTDLLTILRTGAATFSSSVTATSFIPSAATVPTNGMYLSAANTLNFATNTTNRLTINSSGNLGLGITPTTSTAASFIQFGAGAALNTNSTNNSNFWHNTTFDASGNALYAVTGQQSSFYRQINGAHQWFYAAAGTAGTAITFTQQMTLNASGNVGIGTTSPSEKLHIYSSASSTELRMENSTISTYLRSQTDNFNIYVNGGERMRITSGGNVLIGTTTDSGYKLDVNGTGRFSGKVFLNTTTAYTSELNVQAIANNRPAIKAGYGGVSGNGYWILGDNYTTDESLMAIGIDYSSGGLVLGSALAPSTTTNGAFISTQAQFGGYGSAIRLGTSGEIVFYNGTQNSVIAAGSAKTASVALTIAQTGAATFSSSVTASQGNFNQIGNGFAINMTNRNNNQTWGLIVDTDAVDDKILGFQSSYGFTPFYALKLEASGGAATFSSSIKTAAPSGGTAKPFKIGAAAAVTPTSQNRTIEIEIDGVTYYLTAKTTND